MIDSLEKRSGEILFGGLVMSLLVFLFTQIRVVSAEQEILRVQVAQAGKRLLDSKATIVQVDATLAKTEREASRSKDVETMFAAFLSELLDIANIDPDARAISQKWKIQHAATDSAPQNGPAPAPDKSKSQQKR